jgi:hypothetical protein
MVMTELCLSLPRFLYMLLVALDANFRLKNRMRPNEHPDPSLGPGWGYFVEPERYRDHLKNYVAEKDVRMSRCLVTTHADSIIDQYLYRLCGSSAEGHQGHCRFADVGGWWLCVCTPRMCATQWDWGFTERREVSAIHGLRIQFRSLMMRYVLGLRIWTSYSLRHLRDLPSNG